MFEMPFYRSSIDTSVPKVDVVDRNGEVCVRAELPGFNKDEIDVSVNDSTATIKAAHKTEEEDKAEDFYRREISRSYMSRTVSLPVAVDGSRAKASFSNGVLELTVPKTEKSKSQKIEIEG
jgi:HSP20 family protein